MLTVYADGDAAGGGEPTKPLGDAGPSIRPEGGSAQGNRGDGAEPNKLDISQEKFDEIIQREKAKAAAAERKKVEADLRSSQISEADKLKQEKDEAERKLAEHQSSIGARLIKSEARVQASALGIRPERMDAAMKLADFSGFTLDAKGEPDAESIKGALAKVVADYPEFAGKVGPSVGGMAGMSGGTGTPDANAQVNAAIAAAKKRGDWTTVLALSEQGRGTGK
jgi:hypothetical protein